MKIQVLIGLSCLLVAITAEKTEFCYNDVVEGCGTGGDEQPELTNCNAQYGAFSNVLVDLQSYVNQHINNSFQYLLLSTHFSNYETNREGFEGLYRKLSDRAWEDAIELVKYIGKRGGAMDFDVRKESRAQDEVQMKTYELYELASLAKAVDTEKVLAEEAHHIHAKVSRTGEEHHDPEVASYLENNFLHKHSDTIRELAGHTNDLKKLLLKSKQASLAVFLFDEYLQSK